MNCLRRLTSKYFYLISLLVLSGCFGSSKDTVGDHPLDDDPSKPFIEATIEYPGPHSKWAGPQSFSVQIVTWKAGASARVTVTPPLVRAKGRGPSNLSAQTQSLSIEAAREEFARLNTALHVQDASFNGCLLPVRVKLVRVDGALVERQGCRSQSGWPRVASEIANHFIELAAFPKK